MAPKTEFSGITINDQQIDEYFTKVVRNDLTELVQDIVQTRTRDKGRVRSRTPYPEMKLRNSRTHIYSRREINMDRWLEHLTSLTKIKAPLTKMTLCILSSGEEFTINSMVELIQKAGHPTLKTNTLATSVRQMMLSPIAPVLYQGRQGGAYSYRLRPEALDLTPDELYKAMDKREKDITLETLAQKHPGLTAVLHKHAPSTERKVFQKGVPQVAPEVPGVPTTIRIEFSEIKVVFMFRN